MLKLLINFKAEQNLYNPFITKQCSHKTSIIKTKSNVKI